MKGSLPGLIAAFLSALALFALAGFQITSAAPATRLLGRQAAAMIEIDRWLPAHHDDLELLARDRADGVIPIAGLPIPVTLAAPLVTNGDEAAVRKVVVLSMGSALYHEGSNAFVDDKGNTLKPSMEEPIRWSADLLGKGAHGFWQVTLALTLLILVASVAAVLMGGGDPITPVAVGAAFATALSLAVWLLTQLAKDTVSAPVDQEIVLAVRDGAWIGIRNAGAIAVAMIGMRLLLNTFANHDQGWQPSTAWDYPDHDDADAPPV